MMDVYGSFRPYLDEFLEAASKLFEIVVFTASQEQYGITSYNHHNHND